MSFLSTPHYKFNKLVYVTPEFLKSIGINLLLLDLDNTMSPYKVEHATEELIAWADKMREGGIRLFMVSNNKGDRPARFSEETGIPFVKLAKKPSVKGLVKAMELENAQKRETALAGDQIYTDTLAAKRLGITAILVEPIKFTNIFLALRYGVEYPFRLFGKKMRNE